MDAKQLKRLIDENETALQNQLQAEVDAAKAKANLQTAMKEYFAPTSPTRTITTNGENSRLPSQANHNVSSGRAD